MTEPELSLTDELLLGITTLDEDTLEELEIIETFDEDVPEELEYSGIGSISGAQEKSNEM